MKYNLDCSLNDNNNANVKLNEYYKLFNYLISNNSNWQIITFNNNHIILNKKYSELEEINIRMEHNNIFTKFHLTLPLLNSPYSFYKKINDEQIFYDYLNHYIDYISV
jgi:hypothetical protein